MRMNLLAHVNDFQGVLPSGLILVLSSFFGPGRERAGSFPEPMLDRNPEPLGPFRSGRVALVCSPCMVSYMRK